MMNMNSKKIKTCSIKPMTGYNRSGKCLKFSDDVGSHTVCAVMSKKFMDYTKKRGNDLYGVVKPKERWCICENRWLQAYKDGYAPTVIMKATSNNVNRNIKELIRKNTKKKQKRNKQN